MSAFGDCLCNWIAGNFKGITTFVLRRILAIPSWVRPPIIWTLLTSRALPSTQNYSYFLILQGRFCFAKKNRKPREPLSLAIQFCSVQNDSIKSQPGATKLALLIWNRRRKAAGEEAVWKIMSLRSQFKMKSFWANINIENVTSSLTQAIIRSLRPGYPFQWQMLLIKYFSLDKVGNL